MTTLAMRKEACLLIFWATLFICSTIRANAQECGFYYENGTYIDPNGLTYAKIDSEILETESPESTILKVKFFNPNSNEIICISDYLSYTIGNDTLEMNLKGSLDEAYDNGLLENYPSLTGTCSFFCDQASIKSATLVTLVRVNAANDLKPEFNEVSLEVTIEETTPIGVDILSRSDELLYAHDDDLDVTGKDSSIVFSVDNNKFAVLTSSEIIYNTGANNLERKFYFPRVGLAAPWNRQDGTSVTFNLIATDQGSPQNEKSIPITVNIKQVDLLNPKFLQDYYTTIIDASQQAGETLPVKPEPIKAVDEDSADTIKYDIIDKDALDVELVPSLNGGVDVKLKSPVIPGIKKMAYIVIQATQQSNADRNDRVVLAVELPLATETTTTSTTAKTTTGTPETCPPCTTSSPITCPACPTSPTECTTITQTPVQSTTVTSSEKPSESNTTLAVTTETTITRGTCPPCPTCTDPGTSVTSPYSSTIPSTTTTAQNGNVSTDCPVVTCPGTSSTTTTKDGTVPVTDCPVVTCPAVTAICPTVTCAPCAETSTPLSNVSSCPPCETSTSIPTLVSSQSTSSLIDCTTKQPELTTPSTPPKPTVSFQKEQYAAEIIENSDAGTPVVAVKAFSSDNSPVVYSLQPGEDSGYFKIDANTGSITLAASLQKGSFSFHAEAALPSKEKASTKIIVEAVQGAPISGMHFGSPHYKFAIAERSVRDTLVGVIELRNPSGGVIPRITAVEPSGMSGYFYLKLENGNNLQSVSILVNQTFGRTYSGPRVLLDITASSTRAVEMATVADIAINDVNEEPRFTSSLPMVIGYPERTFFDPAVSMPIFTFEASDSDEGENAILSYHLNESPSDKYDIDSKEGHLFVKGENSLPQTDHNLTITVKDLGGLSKSHQFKIRHLKDDEIHVITASGSETLTDEQIASDLSKALHYDNVVVLHKQKTQTKSRKIKWLKDVAADFDYSITVYAIKNDTFIGRKEFAKDLKSHSSDISGWKIESDAVVGPGKYTPDKLSDTATAYTISTAVLATVLGLILVSAVGYLVYKSRHDENTPWSRLSRSFRKRSADNKENGHDLENTFTRASDSSDSQIDFVAAGPRVIGVLSDARPAGSAPEVNTTQNNMDRDPYNIAEDVYQPDSPKPQKSILKTGGNEEDAYCPPTPTPKKSILKEVQQEKESDKLPERVGVSFDPTPEVINVASTSSLDEADKEESSSDESEDGEVAIL